MYLLMAVRSLGLHHVPPFARAGLVSAGGRGRDMSHSDIATCGALPLVQVQALVVRFAVARSLLSSGSLSCNLSSLFQTLLGAGGTLGGYVRNKNKCLCKETCT